MPLAWGSSGVKALRAILPGFDFEIHALNAIDNCISYLPAESLVQNPYSDGINRL
jgi:hypothetical protein